MREEDKEFICDRCCKWPYEAADEQELEEHCKTCPIGREE